VSATAKIARCSFGTVINTRKDLAAEARKAERKAARETISPTQIEGSKPAERRQRAQRFLKDTLAHGPKRVTDVEEAAEKAHIDVQMLAQARADLGMVTSRANTGGAHAVQWSLPG
jgi:hypothetical protein